MHQTICGETPNKVRIYSGDLIQGFLSRERKNIQKLFKKTCVYSADNYIKDTAANYLNILPAKDYELAIKNLILSEYKICESIYPFLGNYFLYRFFDLEKKSFKRTSKKYNKSLENKLFASIGDDSVKNLASWIFKNISLERNVTIEYHNGKDILVDVLNDFVIDLEYDFSFFTNSSGLKVKNYKFVIIDGYIESIGEIHHVMHDSNKRKIPYVIFCHGMSDDVKYNILRNNSEGRTQVLPVDINFNENTLNMLSDIAVIHNSTVVSAKLGQTISQELRKELPSGKSIVFYKNKIIIEGLADKDNILTHRKFLRNRISEGSVKGDVNIDVLKKRLKFFSSKNLNLFLPNSLKKNKSFLKELDYFLRVISNLDKFFVIINADFKESYFVPHNYCALVEEKISRMKNIINNIEKVIMEES